MSHIRVLKSDTRNLLEEVERAHREHRYKHMAAESSDGIADKQSDGGDGEKKV